jgi:type IV pilus assembly protein PilZ
VGDNRRAPRLPVDVKVDYRTAGSFITDYTRNISRGGLFIRTSLPLEVGERVRLRLTLPDGDAPFALDGVVKWIATLRDREKHPPGMGIEFVDFDEDTRRKLEQMVRTYEARAGQDL